MAWNFINRWYMATSGMGLTDRAQKMMSPDQAKSDAEVVYEVEKLIDEQRELRALGAADVPYVYRIAALRKIATQTFKVHMDTADSKVDESDYEARYKAQYEVLMDWAHRKMLEGRDSGPKAQSSSKMDIGNISREVDFRDMISDIKVGKEKVHQIHREKG